jgi:hypothetical protein
MTEGYIYCFSNPSMPGLLKIGATTRTPEDRAKELFTTGVAVPFQVEFSRRVSSVFEKEKQIHKILETYRIPSREFFGISVDNALKVIDSHLTDNIPVFLCVEDVLRSKDISNIDKRRMMTCLKKNIQYQELKEYYDSLTGEEKELFYKDMFKVFEDTQKFVENTTIIWKDDITLVYKVNYDKTIEYIKSIKTSDYHVISFE